VTEGLAGGHRRAGCGPSASDSPLPARRAGIGDRRRTTGDGLRRRPGLSVQPSARGERSSRLAARVVLERRRQDAL